MKVLLDENIDVRFKFRFEKMIHEVYTVRDMEWNGVKNGKLLKLAADYGFDVIVCVDKNLPYQQNISNLPLPIVVVDVHRNVLESLKQILPKLLAMLKQSLDKQVYIVK